MRSKSLVLVCERDTTVDQRRNISGFWRGCLREELVVLVEQRDTRDGRGETAVLPFARGRSQAPVRAQPWRWCLFRRFGSSQNAGSDEGCTSHVSRRLVFNTCRSPIEIFLHTQLNRSSSKMPTRLVCRLLLPFQLSDRAALPRATTAAGLRDSFWCWTWG